MTLPLAQRQIAEAVRKYDEGSITKSMMLQHVDVTLEELQKAAFDAGLSIGLEESDYDVEFEAEIDLDEFRKKDPQ